MRFKGLSSPAVQGWAVKIANHPSRFLKNSERGQGEGFREYAQPLWADLSGLLVLFFYP